MTAVQQGPWKRSSISHSFNYNSLDDMTLPREGVTASVTQEFAGLGGTSDFYKISGKFRMFYLLNDEADLIGSLAGSAGHLVKTTGSLEVFDQFQLGSSDIRGFERNGVVRAAPPSAKRSAARPTSRPRPKRPSRCPSCRRMPVSVAQSSRMRARSMATK